MTVSARMHYTTGTMTAILDILERKNYVRRMADPSDRRRVLVDITPEAQHLLDVARNPNRPGHYPHRTPLPFEGSALWPAGACAVDGGHGGPAGCGGHDG